MSGPHDAFGLPVDMYSPQSVNKSVQPHDDAGELGPRPAVGRVERLTSMPNYSYTHTGPPATYTDVERELRRLKRENGRLKAELLRAQTEGLRWWREYDKLNRKAKT